ncbi:hypothetical protein [Solemya velum gill symbiont]|nr:hypothetical protein [Solemya velum gill symbiont]
MIATGSPDGSGGSLNPKRYLRDGDKLEIEFTHCLYAVFSIYP